LISITRGLGADFTRAKSPLWLQLHRLIHEQSYKRIARAVAKADMAPDSADWAESVRALLPPRELTLHALEIERFTTSMDNCPALSAQFSEAMTIRPPPVGDRVPMMIHPQLYEVVVRVSLRALYVTDIEPENPFFAWAERTVAALGPCWKKLSISPRN
jgi:hypothetical protein